MSQTNSMIIEHFSLLHTSSSSLKSCYNSCLCVSWHASISSGGVVTKSNYNVVTNLVRAEWATNDQSSTHDHAPPVLNISPSYENIYNCGIKERGVKLLLFIFIGRIMNKPYFYLQYITYGGINYKLDINNSWIYHISFLFKCVKLNPNIECGAKWSMYKIPQESYYFCKISIWTELKHFV